MAGPVRILLYCFLPFIPQRPILEGTLRCSSSTLEHSSGFPSTSVPLPDCGKHAAARTAALCAAETLTPLQLQEVQGPQRGLSAGPPSVCSNNNMPMAE